MSTLPEEYDRTLDVGKHYMKGMEPREIGVRMNLSTREVNRYIKDYKELQSRAVKESGTLSQQMYSILSEVDDNWRRVTKEAWEVADEASLESDHKSRLSALSLIERIQKNRAGVFGDAAKNEDADLLRQLEESERNVELVKQALRNIADNHPELKRELYEQLAALQKESPVIEVEAVA
jgi:hypothetical protein